MTSLGFIDRGTSHLTSTAIREPTTRCSTSLQRKHPTQRYPNGQCTHVFHTDTKAWPQTATVQTSSTQSTQQAKESQQANESGYQSNSKIPPIDLAKFILLTRHTDSRCTRRIGSKACDCPKWVRSSNTRRPRKFLLPSTPKRRDSNPEQ